MTHYELRDDPDDLPVICATEAQAWRKAAHRAERLGVSVLIYRMSEQKGETYLGCVT
jgi:hypothetical protein